jgi:hypothetical protein
MISERNFRAQGGVEDPGEFGAPVKLHKDVTAHLKVVIEKESGGGVGTPDFGWIISAVSRVPTPPLLR